MRSHKHRETVRVAHMVAESVLGVEYGEFPIDPREQAQSRCRDARLITWALLRYPLALQFNHDMFICALARDLEDHRRSGE